jgi:hypothetical protein
MVDDQELQREQAEREQESRKSDVTKYDELIEEQGEDRESLAERLGEPPPPRD